MKHEENVERFNSGFRILSKQLNEKYDDCTTVVMNESGYTVGDDMPDVRGLMHIKNELEQRVFQTKRSNILLALCSV